jgi:hypothetical protein
MSSESDFISKTIEILEKYYYNTKTKTSSKKLSPKKEEKKDKKEEKKDEKEEKKELKEKLKKLDSNCKIIKTFIVSIQTHDDNEIYDTHLKAVNQLIENTNKKLNNIDSENNNTLNIFYENSKQEIIQIKDSIIENINFSIEAFMEAGGDSSYKDVINDFEDIIFNLEKLEF